MFAVSDYVYYGQSLDVIDNIPDRILYWVHIVRSCYCHVETKILSHGRVRFDVNK